MKHYNLKFSKLLEHYVFRVAKNYVEQVDTETQNTLINLFIEVGKEPNAEPLCESIEQKLIYQDERIKTIERLIATNQARIEAIYGYIYRIDQLLGKVKTNIANKEKRNRLIKHYQSLKNKYVIYLEKLLAFQRIELRRLDY